MSNLKFYPILVKEMHSSLNCSYSNLGCSDFLQVLRRPGDLPAELWSGPGGDCPYRNLFLYSQIADALEVEKRATPRSGDVATHALMSIWLEGPKNIRDAMKGPIRANDRRGV